MQTAEEFFQKKEYRIPIVFESDDLKEEVDSLLVGYIHDLEKAGADSGLIQSITNYREYCGQIISYYLQGIHSTAFESFEKAIEALQISESPLLASDFTETTLFRGRENKDVEDYSDSQMYHIPLNKRGIISTQRYSFPGLPCLYASASVYTCWVEMNRPSFEKFQVATVKPTIVAKKMKVLDLSNIPQRLSQLMKEEWFDENEYFRYWPILALCAIKVRHDDDPFKPEYIFPQFLLEHILINKRSNEILGIKYASIKAASICEKQFSDDWHTYVNYVFPTHSDSMADVKCEILDSRFKIDHNRSGKELQILTRILEIDNAKTKFTEFGAAPTKADVVILDLSKRHIYTRDGKRYSYVLSAFGMIEMALLRDGFEDIAEDRSIMQEISETEIDEIISSVFGNSGNSGL